MLARHYESLAEYRPYSPALGISRKNPWEKMKKLGVSQNGGDAGGDAP